MAGCSKVIGKVRLGNKHAMKRLIHTVASARKLTVVTRSQTQESSNEKAGSMSDRAPADKARHEGNADT